MGIKARPMLFTRELNNLSYSSFFFLRLMILYRGCEPLTPDDIAETIVFAAGRRENVVIADTLLFPNHQASATIMHRK
jgi:NADP-dependent 3-hydroxy acid dehydrogenase YdfG